MSVTDNQYYVDERPNPRRITAALDLRQLYGPEVDAACDASEPDVDRWEAGTLIPAAHQLTLLADLCRVPVSYFFLPDPPQIGRAFMCDRSARKGNRCHVIGRDVEPDTHPLDLDAQEVLF